MKLNAVLFSVLSITLAASWTLAQETPPHFRLVSVAMASGNQIVVQPSERVAPATRPRLTTRLGAASFQSVRAGAEEARAAAGIGANNDPGSRSGVNEGLAPGQTVFLGATGEKARVSISTDVDTVVVTAPALPR
ncbi:MAG TPA: hypothetical protein VFW15_01505 [Thermoanaerobaculia bacterium]|nr:hypothetical protein [Thermoanaerobaculia bacterium]